MDLDLKISPWIVCGRRFSENCKAASVAAEFLKLSGLLKHDDTTKLSPWKHSARSHAVGGVLCVCVGDRQKEDREIET